MRFALRFNSVVAVVVAVGGSLIATSSAGAQVVIDQQQPSSFATFSGFASVPEWVAQSFTAHAINSAGAGIFIREYESVPGTVSGILDMELWSALPGTVGASELASGTTPFSVTGTGHRDGGTYFDAFWSPIATTPGTMYYLVFTSDVPVADEAKAAFVYSGENSDPYPGGSIYAQTEFYGDITDAYTPYPTDDMTFREYAAVDFTPPTTDATPEPSTIALTGTGLLGVIGVVRRRRNS